jgi:hypothetical protein
MSKKAKRRAARQAFPKAKTTVPPRGRTSAGARGRSSASSRGRASAGSQTLKPPTIKRALITGAILAFIYFALIEWGWKSGATTKANALIAFILFFLYTGVAYGVERFTYQRKLRKLKGSSK